MYISPFTTSRTFTVRLLPPRLPGRMSGSTWLHSSSVKSLGYRSLLRSYRARFSIVHIGGLSTTQAAILASQTLDPIQYVPEQALRVCQSLLGRLDNQAEFSAPERSSRSGLCLLDRESPQHVHEIAEPLAPDLVCPLLLKLAQGWGRMVWTPSTASVCQSGGVASHARRRP